MVAKTVRGLLVLLLGLAVFLPAQAALAQTAPANDDFGNATVVNTLPFTDNIDTTSATTAPDDPTDCPNSASVWYSFTPSQTEAITATTAGSSYDAVISAYTGARGNLHFFDCTAGNASPQMTFIANAGTTYFFMVASFGSGGQLVFNLTAPAPPANDNFASATPITALPFSDTVDTSGATFQPSEPAPTCFDRPPHGTVWYVFTPTVSESVSASFDAAFGIAQEIYAGTSFTNLTPLRCGANELSTIHLTAGTTYYFQVGDFINGSGPLTFHLEVTPPPTAQFFAEPSDPSVFDTVQFIDESFDPGQVGFQTESWDFGDGATGAGSFPSHRYAVDGDYTVTLTVSTVDGRTATASQCVHVRTHDVAITKLTVPTSASAGQTRSITVGVSDKRYPETVQVQLLKGNGQGGFDLVGTLLQSIPVQTGKSTAPFAFSYTFTTADKTVGKVTFEAIATILSARDALPADNTAIASTTVH
jgi:PKD repeat protein